MKIQVGDVISVGSESGVVKALVEGLDAFELETKVSGYKFWSTEGLTTYKINEAKAVLSIYELAVPAYVYTGRSYEYGSAMVRVLATSDEEACKILNKHKTDVEKWLKTQSHRPSLKPLIKTETEIGFKADYHCRKTGLKTAPNVLTVHGGFKRVTNAGK